MVMCFIPNDEDNLRCVIAQRFNSLNGDALFFLFGGIYGYIEYYLRGRKDWD